MNTQQCNIIEPGAGEAYWIVGDYISLKLTSEQTEDRYAFAETTVAPGGGPPPHVHHRDNELFYVLDGDFEFTFADTTRRAAAGTAVYLPGGIVHTFKNVGSTPGRLLIGAVPGGFDKFVPEAGSACTDRSVPAAVDEAAIARLLSACQRFGLEMKFEHKPTRVAEPLPPDRMYRVLGVDVALKLDTLQTGGAFSLAELTCPPGVGVPMHAHRAMDEIFYVLKGSVQFTVAGESLVAAPGTFIRVPRGVMHAFAADTSEPAVVLDYHTPGGFERFFAECDETNGLGGDLRALLNRHGMELPST